MYASTVRALRISAALLYGFVTALHAQTTQALISGRTVDAYSGSSIVGAEVSFESATTGIAGKVRSNSSGYYILPLLSPGAYRIRATAAQYQAQEVHAIQVPVAGRVDVSFRLRPLSDVWEAGQHRTVILPNTEAVVTFYGPDVDTTRSGSFEPARQLTGRLESTVSEVIDRTQLQELPLAGRDAYTMLLTQPGVTADSGTSRGLGFSVNGQRPSASNFLLDGLENNNYLVTGPLTTVAPEALQEYRISTNNFSAEYGRTSGFVANAVSRSGGSDWHGLAWLYTKNDVLNANDFQRNLQGLGRTPVKEWQPGFLIGGPIRRNSLFASAAFEYLRFRGREAAVPFVLPTTSFLTYTAPNSTARRLLQQYPPPAVTLEDLPTAELTISPPSRLDVNRFLLLPRVDYVSRSGVHRIAARASVSSVTRPNFIWTPYRDFVAPLNDDALSLAATLTTSLTPALTNEFRVGFGSSDLRFDRPKPEVPTLVSGDGTVLPGSPAFYSFRNRIRHVEILENLLWAKGAHVWKFGGGVLVRQLDGYLTAGSGGLYGFIDAPFSFVLDRPNLFLVSASRTALAQGSRVLPSFDRTYRNTQFFLFAQDSFRASSRLVLNYGIRYENFGAPANTGRSKDALITLGPGDSIEQRIATATLSSAANGSQQLHSGDHNDIAVRLGFSYSLRENAQTLVRGSYGVFYDRPFDNLWQNMRHNDVDIRRFDLAGRTDYLRPVADALASFPGTGSSAFSALTLYQPGIRTGYVHSYFAGVQHQFTNALSVEVNTLGSMGRKLITTDLVNRPWSVLEGLGSAANPFGYFNGELGPMHYRANQALSDYRALTAVARFRSEHLQFQAAYTWSHSIDNQSDALRGEFFNLDFTALTAGESRTDVAAFSRQFDSRGDRGNSDFDQRHNLVFFSVWQLPHALGGSRLAPAFRNWQISNLAAIRSGLPYSVYASSSAIAAESIENNRADLISPALARVDRNLAGGRQLLNGDAFRAPAPGTRGQLGRNAFQGPGFFNVDLSVSRSFAFKWLGEGGRLTLRADAFNVVNHSNLNHPDSFLGSPTFGVARYGRTERSSGFPLLIPLSETARQIQLMFRLEF